MNLFDSQNLTSTRNSEFSITVNQIKNRYKNVYSYDNTRVKLSMRPGVDGSDYINANM